jgi:chromosome segregation ATPase
MATLEERMARVEHENAELKRSNVELQRAVELLNIALGALVNRATLEKVNEQNSKIFDTLTRHDQFTNQQLAELRGQLTEQDGKIVGLQTEMRQGFAEVKQDVSAQFNRLEKLLVDRLPPPQ